MVTEKYLDITLEEVTFTYTSYARDLEMSKGTENALSGKRSKVKQELKMRSLRNANKMQNAKNVSKKVPM